MTRLAVNGTPNLYWTDYSGSYDDAQTIVLSTGGFVSVFEAQDGSSLGILAQFFDRNGAPIGSTVPVNTQISSEQWQPSATALANGGLVVTWSTVDGPERYTDIHAQILDDSGSLIGDEFLVNTNTEYSQASSSVVALDDGGFLVTWISSSRVFEAGGWNDYQTLQGQYFSEDGTKIGGEFALGETQPGWFYQADSTSLGDGGFVLVHSGYPPEGVYYQDVFVQQFDNAGNAVSAGLVFPSEDRYGDQYDSGVTHLSDGGYVVTWVDLNYPDADIKGLIYNADGSERGTEFQLNTQDGYLQQSMPDVVGLSNGGFLAVWNSDGTADSSTEDGLYAQLFDEFGNRIGEEILIHVAAKHWWPSIAQLEDGDIVLTWGQPYSYFQGGMEKYGYGAFIQTLSIEQSDSDLVHMTQVSSTYLAGAGDDTVFGTIGNDIIVGGTGADSVYSGEGNDAIWAGSGDTSADTLFGEGGNDTIGGGAGNDHIFGQFGDDLLFGGSGDDSIVGGTGQDIVWAGSGADTVLGGTDNDVLGGGADNDSLYGGDGEDAAYGATGIDQVFGGNGDDVLFGGDGDDTLTGGTGNDSLFGGEGNDVLVFAAGHGDDFVGGFSTKGDNAIDLSALGLSGFGALNIVQSGADVVIDTSAGTITLWSTDIGTITGQDFIF